MNPTGLRGIGISAPICKSDLSDLGETLDGVEALGVDFIELPTFSMDLVLGGHVQKGHLALLKAACAGRKAGYSVHGPLVINFFDDPARLQRHFDVLQASMEVAAEVGAVHYVMHSGMMPPRTMEIIDQAYGRQRAGLAKAGDVARDMGLLLCVENLFGGHDGDMHASTPSRLAAELIAVGHPNVWATLDVSHAYLQAGYYGNDFLEEIAQLAPLAKHVHMHDSFGRADDFPVYSEAERLAFGHGDLHLPVGWGSIPWAEVMEACAFPDGAAFNIELKERYWYAAQACVDETRRVASTARLAPMRKIA